MQHFPDAPRFLINRRLPTPGGAGTESGEPWNTGPPPKGREDMPRKSLDAVTRITLPGWKAVFTAFLPPWRRAGLGRAQFPLTRYGPSSFPI